jgi:perosamine synthetase
MKKIFFRLDSGNKIGTGHVQRCLNLADQFDNASIFFICKELKGNLISNIEKKYKVFVIDGDNYDDNIKQNNRNTWLGEDWICDAEKTLNIIKNFDKIDLFIVDHYGICKNWEKYIYPYVNKLFIIDDVDRPHYCHLLQNQHNLNKYTNINPDCIQLLGEKYAILNKDIENIIPKKISELKKINIFLGGADYTNETLKIIEICGNLNLDIKYDIVLGKANPHIEKIKKFCKNKKNFSIYINLENKDFLELLNECDLSIGAAGLTNYERCILNKPFFYLLVVENQKILIDKLQDLNIGFYLGNINDNYSDILKEQILKCQNNFNYLINLSKNCYKFANISNLFNLKNILVKYMENKYIPYGKQTIDEDDIQSVVDVLKDNNFLTTGPKVTEFEEKVAKKSNLKYAIACNNGTSALHMACYAIDIQKDDEVIVPAISFVASANCILYCRGKPVFCDIDEDTMCIDADKIEALITKKTKAIVCVDFAGQLCDYVKICEIAKKYNLYIIEDAAHAIGHAKYYGNIVTFSFHPVKHITTCEGGMSLTNNEEFAKRMKLFRTHGITRDFKEREISGDHYYEMVDLGFNYRIPDLNCALGISQLSKLDNWVERRQEIAKIYDDNFKEKKNLFIPLENKNDNVYHLYIIKLNENLDRNKIFKELKNLNIGANVHYMPIYLHPYYQKLGYQKGLCPVAEKIYKQIISLPMFSGMENNDIIYVYTIINNFIK